MSLKMCLLLTVFGTPWTVESQFNKQQVTQFRGNAGGLTVPTIQEVMRATGIGLLDETFIFQVSNEGSELQKNKAILLKNLKNTTPRLRAIVMSMAMQESTTMNPGDYDPTKTGNDTNYGLNNLNRRLIVALDPSYINNDHKLNKLNDNTTTAAIEYAIAESTRLVLVGLEKSFGVPEENTQWQAPDSMLNFVRGGIDGFISTRRFDCPYRCGRACCGTLDCIGYRNHIASMAYMILQDPRLLTGDTRIESYVKHE